MTLGPVTVHVPGVWSDDVVFTLDTARILDSTDAVATGHMRRKCIRQRRACDAECTIIKAKEQ